MLTKYKIVSFIQKLTCTLQSQQQNFWGEKKKKQQKSLKNAGALIPFFKCDLHPVAASHTSSIKALD